MPRLASSTLLASLAWASLVGCQPIHREAPAEAGAQGEGPAARPAPVPAPVLAPSVEPWQWVHIEGPYAMRDLHEGQQRYELRVDEAADQLRVRKVLGTSADPDSPGLPQWVRAFESHFVDAATLIHREDRLFMLHHSQIASGCTLRALDPATGQVRWETQLQGLGPVAHSKYRNQVQMRVHGDRVIVYGWESQGAYIEVVDASTGQTIEHRLVPDALVGAIEAPPDDPPGWVPPRNPTEMLVMDEGLRVEIDWHAGSSGGQVRGRRGDELEWERPVWALGPLAHSEYLSHLEVEPIGDRVWIRGVESYGKYVEVLEPQTGDVVAWHRWVDPDTYAGLLEF